MRRDNRDSRSSGGRSDRGFSGGRDRGFGGGGSRFGGRDDGPKQMFSAVCSDCGQNCEVPFRPTNGKPVYCSDCFGKNKGRDDDRGGRGFSDSRRDNRGGSSGGSNVGAAVFKGQFDALNVKLDKILAILTNAKTGETLKKDVPTVKKVEEVAKKEKKVVKKTVKKAVSKKPKTKKK